MNTFSFTAFDPQTGQKVQAELEAADEKAAAKLLTDRGLSPIDIKSKKASALISISNRIPTKARVIFTRQLAAMVNAGLPLIQSLNTVMNQTANKNLKTIIAKLITDIEAGSTLSDAMARHPRVFNGVFINLVSAGETSGTLDKSLERLANQQEKDSEIVSKVRGAMIYPTIVIMVLVGVVVFMLTTVLPQVEELYNGLPGVSLPFITRVLLAISKFLLSYWWIMALVVSIFTYGFFQWRRTKNGRLAIDQFKMRVPVLSPLFMKVYMARFARTASTLVSSGVPMIKMLSITADAVGNVHIANSIRKAAEQVKAGRSLSSMLAGNKNFLELVPNMIGVGEESGQLESMLSKLADYYEKEVDNQIKSISTIIEPALMICVGIIALLVVAAVLLPIYSLAGKNLIKVQ